MADPLTNDDVRHVARLARLRPTDEQIEQYRHELASIVQHVARLGELNLDGVEPLAQPHERTNHMGDDEPQPALTTEQALAGAPAVEQRFIAVPKVLGQGA